MLCLYKVIKRPSLTFASLNAETTKHPTHTGQTADRARQGEQCKAAQVLRGKKARMRNDLVVGHWFCFFVLPFYEFDMSLHSTELGWGPTVVVPGPQDGSLLSPPYQQ